MKLPILCGVFNYGGYNNKTKRSCIEMMFSKREGEMSPNQFGDLLVIIVSLAGVIFLLAYLVSLFWVYQDAEKRGKTGCMWLLLIYFTFPFGLIAYLSLRDKKVEL